LAPSCLAVARTRVSCKFAHSIACAHFLLCGFLLLVGCGSGGPGVSGGSGTGGTNPPTITSLNPSSATAGGNAFTLTVNGTNFTSSGTTVTWNGTALATTYMNASEATAPVTAAMIATAGTATVAVTTAAGTYSGPTFTINTPPAPTPPPAPTVTAAQAPLRTRYLRTNAYYDPNSLQFAPPHFSVYDSAHRQFFVSNPYMNEIDVFSAASETQTAVISVPMAWGIDISPVDGSLWAGTFLGDLYNINTSTLSVIARYPTNTIGPSGFQAQTALVLADGNLVLQGGSGGILGVDGWANNVIWNPSTNAMDTGTSGSGSLCNENGGIALDGTRTYVLVTTVDEGGGPLPLCSYDSVTRIATYTTYVPAEATFVRQIVPTPDGTKVFVTTNLDGVLVFNPQTLQMVGQIPPPASGDTGLPDAAGGAVMSLDGTTLYLVDQMSGAIFGYNTASYEQVSTVAHPQVNDSQSWMVASAIDSTGLIIGPIGHGVGFADASLPESSLVADYGQLSSATPDAGPVSGSTPVTIAALGTEAYGSDAPNFPLSQFYVGNSLISGAEMNSSDVISATFPAASSGMVVDLTALFNEGTIALAPEGYSYGPTILEVVPDAATADGGQQGAVIGYGFGSSASAIQVSIGGQSAPIQNLYDYAPINPYPFPVETLTFTIPAGVAGATTISITSPSGTTGGTFTYTPESVSYPVSATLQEGIYDANRNLYFFSDTAKIQVFSPASGTWQTPISLPGITSTSQLLGIAESPDGSLLAVSDFGGQAIFVLDPSDPSVVTRYAMPSNLFAPTGLTVLDNGNIYFAGSAPNGIGEADLWELLTSTGQFQALNAGASEIPTADYIRVLLSPDQTKVYALEGAAYWVNTSTNGVDQASEASAGETDGAVSADGSTVYLNDYFTDATLNPENATAYIDWETWLPTATYGQKLSQDGSILYQPLTNGIDLIERNTGRLLYRVQVPGIVANVYDSMFLGASSGTIGYITSSGITFVDLSSLTIPAAASTPFPAALSTERKGTQTVDRTGLKPLPHAGIRRPTLAIPGVGNPARY
jgi:hypothetical protein